MPTPNQAVITPAQQFANMLADQGVSIDRLNVNALRPVRGMQQNALLQRYEWEEIDAAVIEVARTQLNGIQDLIDLGLVQRLGGLGTLSSTAEQLGDMSDANISMDGETPGEEDATPYSPLTWPVPIIHKDFRLNIRTLEASRRLGDALDTTGVRTATRKVLEAAEAMLFSGTGMVKVGTNQGQGYTNKTQRVSQTAAAWGGGDFGTWGNGFKTVSAMINTLKGYGFNGPFGVYVARTQYGQLINVNTYGLSEIQVMLEGIPGLRFVKASDELSNGNSICVNLDPDTVDVAIAVDIVPVQWTSMGGMVEHFKVMTAMTPRVKHTAASSNNCGVAHATGC